MGSNTSQTSLEEDMGCVSPRGKPTTLDRHGGERKKEKEEEGEDGRYCLLRNTSKRGRSTRVFR